MKRFKLISCEVFYREMCHAVAQSPHVVDIEFLPKGLHDLGSAAMRENVQATLDKVDSSRYDAVLFGYGLCNNGLVGVTAREIPVVLPRAHDCITLFLGSKERYLDYFQNNPGTYFKTTGWIERGENPEELNQLSIQTRSGMNQSFEELVEKYGVENARFLYETLCEHTRNYGQFTFIAMGVEPNGGYEQKTREDAAQRGWKFDRVRGDLSLIQRMVNGEWGEKEFLVVPPGGRISTSFDDSIITLETGRP